MALVKKRSKLSLSNVLILLLKSIETRQRNVATSYRLSLFKDHETFHAFKRRSFNSALPRRVTCDGQNRWLWTEFLEFSLSW